MVNINIILSFKKVKELIESLPEEVFKGYADLKKKKEMADAAMLQLEGFLGRMMRDECPDPTGRGRSPLRRIEEDMQEGCEVRGIIDPPAPV